MFLRNIGYVLSISVPRDATIHSLFISVLTNLMHKICFTISFILCLCMCRAHVLIIRSKLHYTASGIITPIGVMIPDYDEYMYSKHVEA